MLGIRARVYRLLPSCRTSFCLPIKELGETRRPRVVDGVLMIGYPDTIIGLAFPTLGIPLGRGVAQFLLGQVKTNRSRI